MIPAVGSVELSTVLDALAMRRPVFHSEADFQHELAWQFRLHDPTLAVRLEVPLILDKSTGRREYLDLLVSSLTGMRVAIELKYATERLEVSIAGEEFQLARKSAQDTATYDVVKDISRLERFVNADQADSGLLVLLANDSWYWRPPASERATGAQQFRVHEGARLTGVRAWQEASGPGTRKGRTTPISLLGSHICHWEDYSAVTNPPFRMLVIPVSKTIDPHSETGGQQ